MRDWLRRAGLEAGAAVAFVCAEADPSQRNSLIAEELVPAFARLGVSLRILDYRRHPRDAMTALKDPANLFCICFDGFGAELLVATRKPGGFRSAFEYFGKPLFDIMHDCPAHEIMGHQVDARFRHRFLLIPNYDYVAMAQAMGQRNARFVPSITYPAAVCSPLKPLAERSIDVLVPVTAGTPERSRERHTDVSYRARVYRDIFDAVVIAATANLRLDPLQELCSACREAGLLFDPSDPDSRFLLTTVVDCVETGRQRTLLHAIAHLPVTLASSASFDDLPSGSCITRILPAHRSDLLEQMRNAKCVVTLTSPITGYDDVAMAAFTAGCLVLSSPNHLLQGTFGHQRGSLMFQTQQHLVDQLGQIVSDFPRLAAIAACGHRQAMAQFSPTRLAETILSILLLEQASEPPVTAPDE